MNGLKLRLWRYRMGMTQPEAAESLGISERMLRNYETDAWEIPLTVELATEGLEARQVES